MIKAGDTVAVHYTGTLNDGTVFDSSVGREPLSFQAGAGMMIKGFDDAVMGMTVGETKKVNIPSVEAYGEYRDDMLIEVNRMDIPENIPLELGGMLTMHNGQYEIPVIIKEVTAIKVVVDANHTLAGQDLNFDIEIVSVEAGGDMEIDYTQITPQ
jgi:peptidylprolyl isomerase